METHINKRKQLIDSSNESSGEELKLSKENLVMALWMTLKRKQNWSYCLMVMFFTLSYNSLVKARIANTFEETVTSMMGCV